MAATYRLTRNANGRPSRIKDDFTKTSAPGVGDDFSTDGYKAGSLWLNTSTNTLYVCESAATGAAVWHALAGSAAVIDYGETGDIVTQAYSDTPDAGALDEAARADHRHGMPASGAIDWGETADITTLDYDDVADAGVLAEAARADHVHGMPAEGVGGGSSGVGEVLMVDGITAPPDPLLNEDEDDWMYEG